MIIEDEQGRSFCLTVSLRENDAVRHLHQVNRKHANQENADEQNEYSQRDGCGKQEIYGKQYRSFKSSGYDNLRDNGMTFAELCEEYMQSYVPNQLKPGTAQTYSNAVNRYLIPAFGHMYLNEISSRTISDYLDRAHFPNEDRLLTRAKLRMLCYCMRSIMKYALKHGYIEHDPCVDVIVPERKDKRDTRKKYLEDREIAAFLKLFADYNQYNTAIKLLLYTGLRSGELLGLKWQDIDFRSHIIRVDKSLTNIPGSFILTTPKSEAGRRTIYMNKTIESLLREHKRNCACGDRYGGKEQNHKSGYETAKNDSDNHKHDNDNAARIRGRRISGDELVFTNTNGGFLTRQTLNRKFHKATAGTPFASMSLHCLRHSNATMLLNNGLDLKLVAEHLGHSKISTTADIYANVTEEGRRRVANVLEKKLDKVLKKAESRHT